jgi:hypothetical protein
MSEPGHNRGDDALADSALNVETAFAWAESHARMGDFEYALKWLEVGEKLTDGTNRRLTAKRKRWTRAVEQQRGAGLTGATAVS